MPENIPRSTEKPREREWCSFQLSSRCW